MHPFISGSWYRYKSKVWAATCKLAEVFFACGCEFSCWQKPRKPSGGQKYSQPQAGTRPSQAVPANEEIKIIL